MKHGPGDIAAAGRPLEAVTFQGLFRKNRGTACGLAAVWRGILKNSLRHEAPARALPIQEKLGWDLWFLLSRETAGADAPKPEIPASARGGGDPWAQVPSTGVRPVLETWEPGGSVGRHQAGIDAKINFASAIERHGWLLLRVCKIPQLNSVSCRRKQNPSEAVELEDIITLKQF